LDHLESCRPLTLPALSSASLSICRRRGLNIAIKCGPDRSRPFLSRSHSWRRSRRLGSSWCLSWCRCGRRGWIYCQRRVVASHASGPITHSHREERTVVPGSGRRSRIRRVSRSSNVHAILRPLIAQWRRACRRHAEAGSLSCVDCLIGWLGRDCRWRPYR